LVKTCGRKHDDKRAVHTRPSMHTHFKPKLGPGMGRSTLVGMFTSGQWDRYYLFFRATLTKMNGLY
jgi:hypothetical protein